MKLKKHAKKHGDCPWGEIKLAKVYKQKKRGVIV